MEKKKSVQCLFSFNLMNYKKGTLNTHLSILGASGDIAYPRADSINYVPPLSAYAHCQQQMPREKAKGRNKIIAFCVIQKGLIQPS